MKMERRNKHSPCRLRQGLIFFAYLQEYFASTANYPFMDILKLASDILICVPAIFISLWVVAKVLVLAKKFRRF